MAEYVLDCSLAPETRALLDAFTLAYVEAAMWTLTGDDGESLDYLGLHDIAPETIERAKLECRAFQSENADLLNGSDPARAGHDFWLTRNRHGCGFWDRSDTYPHDPEGEQLTEAAHSAGEAIWYVGDDGLIYQS